MQGSAAKTENKKLTHMQERFVEEFAKDPTNGTQAAIRAGYSKNGAARAAVKLKDKPHVMAAIRERQKEMADNTGITPEFVVQKIARTVERCEDDDNFNATAVLRGLELLGRHLGMWVDRQEISGPDGEAIKMEKTQNEADAFARAIAGLSARSGASRKDEAA